MENISKNWKSIFPNEMIELVKKQFDLKNFNQLDEVEFQNLFWIIFTSRSGSTHLAHSMYEEFEVGYFSEELNLHQIGKDPAHKLRQRISEISVKNHWCCKSGEEGVIVAEHLGLVEQHLDRIHFCFHYRENLIDQAISLTRATLTGKFWKFQGDKDLTEKSLNSLRLAALTDETLALTLDQLKIIYAANNRLLRWIKSLNVNILVSSYEENLKDDYKSIFKKIEFLGLTKTIMADEIKLNLLSKLEPQKQSDEFNILLKNRLYQHKKHEVLRFEELHQKFILELKEIKQL